MPEPDTEQTIVANSTTAKLIENTSSNDGSFDNIVDGASCFAINFPYTVEVNGITITIESEEGLELIEEIFDELEDDEDILDIIFPITITLGDYTEITINGKEDLRALAEQCIEGGDDDDIECIDFVYPITLFTFDANKEQTGSVTVESDRELRRFFAGLDEDDLIGIDFPITLVKYDGTEIRVENMMQLVDAIERAKDACDEDDDDDYNDDDFSQERLENLLVECPWLINEVQRDDMDQSGQYIDYVMNFTENGEVVVKDRMGNSLSGTWSTRVAEHKVLIKLEFDVLVDFNLEWMVYELSEGKIKLYAEGGNKIIMYSACDLFNTTPDTLREILKECSWIIKKVKNQGEEIERLLGFEFNFLPEGVITLSDEVTVSEGTWEITTNEQGRLVMAITMGNEPGVSFEWPLSDLRNDRLKFEVEEVDYELVLQRVCDDNNADGDVPEIRNIMMGGQWIVAQYKDDGVDETVDFNGYSVSFMADHQITLYEGTEAFGDGLWRVLRNSDHKLKVYLNFGEELPFNELTDDWTLVSITNDRIELKDVSGDDGSEDILVFEKQ